LIHFRHHSTYEPNTFENAARYLNSETDHLAAMIALCPRQVWWSWVAHLWEPSGESAHLL